MAKDTKNSPTILNGCGLLSKKRRKAGHYYFSPKKCFFSLFKFFCCCCCCCGLWDCIMGYLMKMHGLFVKVNTVIMIIFALYSDWYNVQIFRSYRLSLMELNETTAENLGNFFSLVFISGITVVVVLTKLYTKGKHGHVGKDNITVPSPTRSKWDPRDLGVHAHYFQHIMFARVFYIPHICYAPNNEHSQASNGFLLVTTCTNAVFSILKVFLHSFGQDEGVFVLRLLQLIFSLLSMLWNMITVGIDLATSERKKRQQQKDLEKSKNNATE
ncbi:hypothetical protein EDD21DRAFT_379170 [Dissophora ornata]|nr:hypothetical protein EDD21DRAFT_379170 [Dissophora ornata]